MKYLFPLLFACLFVGACSTSEKNEEHVYTPVNLPKEKPIAQDGYICPMKCEGDKVYQDSSKKCPVCDMDLVKAK